jgi:hypothetical protein
MHIINNKMYVSVEKTTANKHNDKIKKQIYYSLETVKLLL